MHGEAGFDFLLGLLAIFKIYQHDPRTAAEHLHNSPIKCGHKTPPNMSDFSPDIPKSLQRKFLVPQGTIYFCHILLNIIVLMIPRREFKRKDPTLFRIWQKKTNSAWDGRCRKNWATI